MSLGEPYLKNNLDTRVELPEFYDVMYSHMYENASGKTPMLLFIGYDGCRADMLTAVADNTIHGMKTGVARVRMGGTLLLGKAGGKNKGDQPPVTAPGWTAIFTGTWSDVNKVYKNKDAKSPDVNTLFYKLNESGIAATFAYSWANYHNHIYTDEYAAKPYMFCFGNDDDATVNSMLTAISGGMRAVFGILEYTDKAGHMNGFNPKNANYKKAFQKAELAADKLINAVFARPTYEEEDWMIIIASDHGGYFNGHESHNLPTTTTFFAVNKKI